MSLKRCVGLPQTCVAQCIPAAVDSLISLPILRYTHFYTSTKLLLPIYLLMVETFEPVIFLDCNWCRICGGNLMSPAEYSGMSRGMVVDRATLTFQHSDLPTVPRKLCVVCHTS